ncbi:MULTISPECIES: TMEM165/GDT1 family protein [Leptolyngbya]|jgi:putative Ca2+/H+ antiporter (TMEM165/GDT1 family)|uniref:GDT1 family protein n=2 Tax=Leptolyngbya boryana TaxID=1184 RepID=A0A1Z4JEC5_LEPBY|nr:MULTISPECIES: TMEM165/GDT1 family protein [Leptolyngbya]BAY55122.1 putative membrane protein [Leptolyngbya boryana NIES-2135]MBD1855376.1 TMEM165/GDT1 family protein [Leptolyngbya sp. FACHB-1624]MBD2366102.1 TMEM165/GDT1 family protein [Leptolyngbya sp. FACHB-161]MBD2372282.1 TMEM165/GDT1 family protein [Leptolyngbya sp. FACHB-238]MBD2396705.1 TMEM165/GDT1 family protein [Leptolyngbya sp. FACHB-239]
MDWQLMGISFVTVFLAELGDKSQLAAIALSSNSNNSPKAIFLGTVAALVLASFIGVILGEGTAQLLPTKWTKIIAAIGFLILAVRLLWFSNCEEEA